MKDISAIDAGIVALLGYAVVFVGLIVLMLVVMAVGKAFVAAQKRKTAAQASVAVTVTEIPAATAPGSAGGVKIHSVDPKTAAMLMAVVADKTGKPLNELRFISIKEVQ